MKSKNAKLFVSRMSLTEAFRISGIFQFLKPVYVIRDPKVLKKMAVKDFDHFVDHRVIIDETMDKMFGKSLISLTGQKWRGELSGPQEKEL